MYNISVKITVGDYENVVFKCIADTMSEVKTKASVIYGTTASEVEITAIGYIQEILSND